jgi:hypothetical protein
MAFAFGDTLVCDDTTSVMLDGDVSDPSERREVISKFRWRASWVKRGGNFGFLVKQDEGGRRVRNL